MVDETYPGNSVIASRPHDRAVYSFTSRFSTTRAVIGEQVSSTLGAIPKPGFELASNAHAVKRRH